MSVAYLFNGFKDLTLVYGGLPYYFPYNEVTKYGDQVFRSADERSRNHESNPVDGAVFETKRDAIEFFTDMMNRHYQGYQTEGVVWIGTKDPTVEQQKRTMELGRIKKMKIVEQSLADRRSALAKGGQPEIDTEIVQWMQAYGIYDELYSPKPAAGGGFTEDQLQQIGAIMGAVTAQLNKPAERENKR